jgi:hypothetical protein
VVAKAVILLALVWRVQAAALAAEALTIFQVGRERQAKAMMVGLV